MVDEAFTSVGPTKTLRPGPIASRIGNQVRSWRQETRLSEAELAAALNVPIDAFTAAENGDPCFTVEQLVTICQAFGVSPGRFLENVV